MPRLPRPPDIEWKPDGTPVAVQHGDIYFTAGDGLAESRTVFLKGNALPDRWRDHPFRERPFVVAETGFGTGLNLLALWDAWRKDRPKPPAWLHFVSFEAFPMRRANAARALSSWPELSDLAGRLIDRWPDAVRGVRQIDWPEDRISLTLHVGEIAEMLPDAEFRADAWFLDGFSPSRNADMWADALYPLVAERTAPGGTAATFTVAGAVRRGLDAAGFDVAKVPGHGRKRERLEARLHPGPDTGLASRARPERVAILGAGIMGACAARLLADRGLAVVVHDTAAAPALGGSGNRLALMMPRLDAADTVQARLLVDAYLAARQAYQGRAGVTETEVRQTPRTDAEAARFAKVLADPPLPLEDLEALSGMGMLLKRALILEPRRLIEDILSGIESRFGVAGVVDLQETTVDGTRFDAILFANAMAAEVSAPWLGLTAKLGQVEHVEDCPDAPPSALAAGHYALSTADVRLWGATFETTETPDMPQLSDTARAANAEALASLTPWWLPQVRDRSIISRAAVRATTADRLPVAGPLPDADAVKRVFAPLAKGQTVDAPIPLVPGAWLATGLGSRGFTFAPWLAHLLAAQMTGAPWPASRKGVAAVDPARILIRRLKRGLS